jgi:hypothetical protein
VADCGCFISGQILACEEAGITVTLPKPTTSNQVGDQDNDAAWEYAAGQIDTLQKHLDTAKSLQPGK